MPRKSKYLVIILSLYGYSFGKLLRSTDSQMCYQKPPSKLMIGANVLNQNVMKDTSKNLKNILNILKPVH